MKAPITFSIMRLRVTPGGLKTKSASLKKSRIKNFKKFN